jgi:hypothetical protein
VIIKRRITIHSTKSRVVMVKGATKEFTVWCEDCGKVVRMVAPEEAASLVQVDSRVLYRDIGAGEIHFLEGAVLLICCNSLLARFADSYGAKAQNPQPDSFRMKRG